MFGLAILLLIIALIAYFLGEGTVGAAAITAAKICFVIGLVLILLGIFFGATFWSFGPPVYRTYP